MNKFLIFLLLFTGVSLAEEEVIFDPHAPHETYIGPIIHETLPEPLLKRIKAISDTFQGVDGVSYAKSVDLYKRDVDPEASIMVYEEMARVYKEFCTNRCSSDKERKEVYRLLLLRSIFSSEENVLKSIKLSAISTDDAKKILGNFKLEKKSKGKNKR